jgi:hypothetical protein
MTPDGTNAKIRDLYNPNADVKRVHVNRLKIAKLRMEEQPQEGRNTERTESDEDFHVASDDQSGEEISSKDETREDEPTEYDPPDDDHPDDDHPEDDHPEDDHPEDDSPEDAPPGDETRNGDTPSPTGLTYVVWANLRGFPYWPATVIPDDQIPDILRNQQHELSDVPVHFFVDDNVAWINTHHVKDFGQRVHPAKAKISRRLRRAIQEAEDYISQCSTSQRGGKV